MSTTVEMRDKVLAHQFNATRYGDLILTWLDEAQKKLVRDVRQRTFITDYDFTTTANDNSYSLPSNYMDFIKLIDETNDDLIVPMNENDFEDIDEGTLGTAKNYVIIGSTIYLYPTPDAGIDLRLRYWRKPTDIAADVNPEIDEDYHDLLEHYALWRCYVAEHDYEAAEYHKNQWLEGKNEMKADVHQDTIERPRQVPHMWVD